MKNINKPRVLVAQLGARKHYLEPILFQELGILDSFHSDFYANNYAFNMLRHPLIYKLLSKKLKALVNRYDPLLNGVNIFGFPRFAYEYARKLNSINEGMASEAFVWAGQEFNRLILAKGLGNANIIYGFNGASLELFQYAKLRGIKCILDQTLAERSVVHQLLLEEERYWSGWSKSVFTVKDCDLKLMQREQEEQDLADHIICGSQFVKDSLITRGINEDKISVISIGRSIFSHSAQDNVKRKVSKQQTDSLRILFVGEVSLRKGIPYLLEALGQLKENISFQCKIAGAISIKSEKISEYHDVCEFLGRVPRAEMSNLYKWADVFVLPSICEGSAMVTYEALIHGLPIITTYNSGSIVRDGVDGFITSIRDVEAIAECLVKIYQSRSEFFDYKSRESYLKIVNKEAYDKFKNILIN